MLHAAFFNRLPKYGTYADYKEWSVNKLYIIVQIFLSSKNIRTGKGFMDFRRSLMSGDIY